MQPVICSSIDWAATGAMLGGVATAVQTLVVAAAAWIALAQYRASVNTERAKLTFTMFDKYIDNGLADFQIENSPTSDILQNCTFTQKRFGSMTSDEKKAFNVSILKALNYFDQLLTMYERKDIDNNLLLLQFDELIVTAYFLYRPMVANSLSQLPRFKELAEIARVHYRDRGGTDITLGTTPLP